jgi:hypothetical protein
MKRFFGTCIAFWTLICSQFPNKRTAKFQPNKKTNTPVPPNKLRKVPFYSQIPTTRIRTYQAYINRAFQLSPTLEFEKTDLRFNKLLAEAARNDSLDQIDLELMRMQYVLADKAKRKKYRPYWAVKVINRKKNDFFPSPWSVVSGLFVGNRRNEAPSRLNSNP